MITKRKYLNALAIVEAYNKQETERLFTEKGFEVLSHTEHDKFIIVNSVQKRGNEYVDVPIRYNANILSVRRLSDGAVFTADNTMRCKTVSGHGPFFITHFWWNDSLRTISVGGHYKKNDNYFACNICSLQDLEKKEEKISEQV
jgi:hypothetical protein